MLTLNYKINICLLFACLFVCFQHLVSGTCIVCGNLDQFVIRKCLKKDITIKNPLGWKTDEKLKSSAIISTVLMREETTFKPVEIPLQLKEKKSLIFELVETQDQQYGDLMPQPDLLSSPRLPFQADIFFGNRTEQIVDELTRIASEVFQSPESCSCSRDVTGHLSSISKQLSLMSFHELNDVKKQVNSSSNPTMTSLFYDVLSVVGTNPSIMLIKQNIESGELRGPSAENVLQSTFRSVKTPTEKLLRELVFLIKNLKNGNEDETSNLFRIGMAHMSKLFHRACIHPVRRSMEFPVRVFGHFCSKDSSVITDDWIPFLETEVERSNRTDEFSQFDQLSVISSLGKLGHFKGIQSLVKVIDGRITKNPVVRSFAVYSLKPISRLNPDMIKPIILSIIDNPAENTQVRIAAIAVLPWSQPSMAELQKIAVRSWFEPSKQVSSFVHSTFKNLAATKIPELKTASQKAAAIIEMLRPLQYGIQYSHNTNFEQFVNYLKSSISTNIAWVYNEKDTIPSKISISNDLFYPGFVSNGISFSIYSEGMDFLIEKMLYNEGSESPLSKMVKDQLDKISAELKIESPSQESAEVILQSQMADFESLLVLNKDYLKKALENALKGHQQQSSFYNEGFSIESVRSIHVVDIQQVGPTSAGFLQVCQVHYPLLI